MTLIEEKTYFPPYQKKCALLMKRAGLKEETVAMLLSVAETDQVLHSIMCSIADKIDDTGTITDSQALEILLSHMRDSTNSI